MNFFRIGSVFIIFQALIAHTQTWADPSMTLSATEEPSTWQLIQSKLRAGTFTEFMTPAAFSIDSLKIPNTDGSGIAPSNVYTDAWAGYEFAPNYELLYWQRFTVNLQSNNPYPGVHALARNPRFALRRTHVFNNPSISSIYDIYIQPGVAPEATLEGRSFEIGCRTFTNYNFPSSRLSVGAATEFTVSLSSSTSPITDRADIYGWAMPWLEYKLSKFFSTEHFVTVNYQHKQGTPWSSFDLDAYLPFIQNGIGITFSDQLWAAVLINNYLIVAPSLQNTWASVWIMVSLL